MSVRIVTYSAIAAMLAALLLAACAANTAAPSPLPTATPIVTTCHGWVTSRNASRRFTVTTEQRAMSAPTPQDQRLVINPTLVALSSAHPLAKMTISEAHYNGPFAVFFDSGQCDFALFLKRTSSPGRMIAEFEL